MFTRSCRTSRNARLSYSLWVLLVFAAIIVVLLLVMSAWAASSGKGAMSLVVVGSPMVGLELLERSMATAIGVLVGIERGL